MKTKSFVTGLLILFVFGFSAGVLTAQEKEGTFIEESGDAQDSTKTANILDYSKIESGYAGTLSDIGCFSMGMTKLISTFLSSF